MAAISVTLVVEHQQVFACGLRDRFDRFLDRFSLENRCGLHTAPKGRWLYYRKLDNRHGCYNYPQNQD